MIKLNSKSLKATTVTHLQTVQQAILNEPDFASQAKKASSNWKSKTSSNDGKAAFKDIKEALIDMCAGIEICVYCEQNEASDIEHIFPKKLYPEKAFIWDNYVLACSKCNTHHKSDKFSIFSPAGSPNTKKITPARGVFIEPENADALFINQRVEDPMDFLELDLVNKQFIFTERHASGTREFEKGKYTKELLQLNTRAALVANRKNAARFYISRLEKYVNAKKAVNFKELADSLNDDWGGVNQTADFESERTRILNAIKEDIFSYGHPTVWKELIRQRNALPKTNSLLSAATEVLGW
jgi:hypothetical protein